MKYRIVHNTTYQYSEPASLSQNELYLHPRETATQLVLGADLAILPEPEYLHRRTDYFGNTAQVFMVSRPHNELAVTATSVVEVSRPRIPDPEKTPGWEGTARQLAAHDRADCLEAFEFVFPSPLIETGDQVRDYAHPSFTPERPVLAGAIDLMGRIFTEFEYDKSATTVDTPLAQVLADRRGVCQDFAHLAIGCLRSLGLAARYISGYLKTTPPPGKPKLVGADASHAWISLFVPGMGWVDLDPTNNMIVADTHITLAWGRDYGDVTPVKGVVMGGGMHALSVSVDVSEID